VKNSTLIRGLALKFFNCLVPIGHKSHLSKTLNINAGKFYLLIISNLISKHLELLNTVDTNLLVYYTDLVIVIGHMNLGAKQMSFTWI
jgi:hypothetical protein